MVEEDQCPLANIPPNHLKRLPDTIFSLNFHSNKPGSRLHRPLVGCFNDPLRQFFCGELFTRYRFWPGTQFINPFAPKELILNVGY